jgi:hypothetical protein
MEVAAVTAGCFTVQKFDLPKSELFFVMSQFFSIFLSYEGKIGTAPQILRPFRKARDADREPRKGSRLSDTAVTRGKGSKLSRYEELTNRPVTIETQSSCQKVSPNRQSIDCEMTLMEQFMCQRHMALPT